MEIKHISSFIFKRPNTGEKVCVPPWRIKRPGPSIEAVSRTAERRTADGLSDDWIRLFLTVFARSVRITEAASIDGECGGDPRGINRLAIIHKC